MTSQLKTAFKALKIIGMMKLNQIGMEHQY